MTTLRTRLQTALRLVWQTAPRWTLVNVALVLAQGALPLAALYLMKRIVDAVAPRSRVPSARPFHRPHARPSSRCSRHRTP